MENFTDITNKIIDNLEGGYYHPLMLADGRVNDKRYASSGETMFGIDRLTGGNINYTTAGINFWNIIDSLNARYTWKWNYKGGNLEKELKNLTAQMIQPVYNTLSNFYLSPKAKKIVESDARLLFHFIYACWNGAGWFKKFADIINLAVQNGITNNDKLWNVAINSRLQSSNSLINQGGEKIDKLFARKTKTWIPYVLIIIVLFIVFSVLTYFLLKNKYLIF